MNPYLEIAQALTTDVEYLENMAQKQHGRPQDKMGEFMRLKPPFFARSRELLEAEDWIRIIERKLDIFKCIDPTKVILVNLQLTCFALAWWEIIKAAHKDGISWNKFWKPFVDTTFRRLPGTSSKRV
ncbi:hypothetical protein BS78_K103100 [Paspalum vaginatum]|uniref:Retrotransposon gag domain-containing protein n=1 Tax=Paspalum vaginatum TaxID=158149 RepID=A0A9W8CCL2_9POAL|nr:hypothetical protein BS78_K103100 [Paspalum vaginatum]